MATKIGYVRQEPSQQINWAEVGANFTGMLNEEARVREAKKAEIDRATREQMNVLKNTPMGDSANVRQWGLDYGADAQNYLLMLNAQLKSGKLKPRDYTLLRQNLADGTDQTFTLIQEYQNEYAEKMERLKSNDPNASSQYLEQYLMETAEGFGNFNKSKLVINPTTGEVMVGFINEKGELESDPNKLVGVNNLRNRITSKFDKYNMDAAVLQGKEMFGEFEGIKRTIGSKSKLGAILQFSDPTLRTKEAIAKYVSDGLISEEQAAKLATYDKTEDAWLESQLSMYNVSSLLTDNLRNIGGKPFKYTANPAEQDENTILYKQVDGQIVLDFESEIGKKQREIAKDGLRTVLRGALDHTEKITTVDDYTAPQQPTATQIEAGNLRREQNSAVTNIAKLYYGNDSEVAEAITFLRGVNPNIDLINRDGDSVEITYNDGKTEFLKFGNLKQGEWVKGSANFFLPSDKKIADVNAVLNRSGVDTSRGFNASSKGESVSIVEKYEPVNETYKRVIESVTGFKPDIFEADDEDDTLPNMRSLLQSIPATKNWTANTTGYGTTDEIEVKDGSGKLLISFNLDDLDTNKATTYINQLKDVIIANTTDEDKATMIEGKQQKVSSASATSKKSSSEATSGATQTQVKIARPKQ